MRRQEHESRETSNIFPIQKGPVDARSREEIKSAIDQYVRDLAAKTTDEWQPAKELMGGKIMLMEQNTGGTPEAFKKNGLKYRWTDKGLEVRKATEAEINAANKDDDELAAA